MEIPVVAVVCLVLLSGCCHTSRGDHQGIVSDGPSTWQGARNTCQQRQPSCDLSTQDPQRHRDFWNSLPLTVGGSYWIGARALDRLQWQQSKSPFFQEVGCFVKPEGLTTDQRPMKANNGPERCMSKCPGSVVGVQGTLCYCLSGEQVSSLVQLPLEECYLYCNKDPNRCGGDDSRLSIYKIPDRTIYEKRGKPNFFWTRSHNNENEFILITNKPGNQQKQFCVSPEGTYSTAGLKEPCSDGGRPLSFHDVDVREFLQVTSSRTDWDNFSFRLPLAFYKQPLWLDGTEVTGYKGKGPCVALTFDGQGYSLDRKPCKAKLPSVCSCYTQPQTTESTTEPTTTTTTTTLAPETTTTTMDTTTTTYEPETATTTTTTTTEATTTMTTTMTLETTSATETTTTTETETPTPSTTPSETPTTFTPSTTPSETTTTFTTSTTPPAYSTETVTPASISEKTTVATPEKTTTYASMITSTSTPEKTKVYASENDTSSDSERGADDSNMLFPFSDMKDESRGSSRGAPPPTNHGGSTSGDGNVSAASASIETIVGATVGALALILIVVIVVIVVVRKRRESSATLLKNKNNKKAAPATNYPI